MNKQITRLGLASLVILSAICTYAEKDKVFDLGEMVVTASKNKEQAMDATSTISVIDEAEIEASNADYVMDVIGTLPGVYIRKNNIYGRQDIEIRGLGSNARRIGVLVDGRPEKMSLFGCTVAQTLPLSNVERIEVIRGPESVLYGTDAMGGVVNIITKRMVDPGYYTSGSFMYGSYNTWHALLRQGGNTGTFDYYATYDHKQTDGHRDNAEYRADFLSLRTGYQIDDHWRAELSGQYFKDNEHDPGPTTDPYTNDDHREYERYSWDADVIGSWDDSEFSITVYDNEGHHKFDMPSIDDYWDSRDRTIGVQTKLTHMLFEKDNQRDLLTLGYEYQYQWAEPEDDWVEWARANMPARFMDFGPYQRNNNDVFVLNEYTFGKWINALGLRVHHDDEDSDVEWIPQAGILYHCTTNISVRAKVAKGYRQPRFSELHLFPAHNEELDPEKVWSYECSVTYALNDTFGVFVTPFYMDVDNLIQQESNDSPPPAFLNKNSGAFYIRGLETGCEVSPLEDLLMTVYYTWTDIEDGPESNPNINREGKPEHVVNAVIDYEIGRFSISLEGEYVAGLYDSDLLAGGDIEKVDDFFVAGLKATCDVNEYLQLMVGIDNLFDEDYEQIPGYPMPGTTVNVGLKAEM